MKHIGLIVFILGTLLLIIPGLANFESKVTLVTGLSIMLVGIVLHCILTRIAIDKQK